MKRLIGNILGIVVGMLLGSTLVVIAEIAIPAGSVSYSNDQTNATTVESALDELIDNVVKDYECSGSSCKKCVRARVLHTEECMQTASTHSCSGAGYTNFGLRGTATITYGNIQGNTGVLKSGDAFDCDVNGDGLYDSDTERFYYVSDLDSETAVLIYYNNVVDGIPNNEQSFAYEITDRNFYGPKTAIEQLPTKNQWKNVSLKNSSRNITTETGGVTTSLYEIENPFSYKEYVARFLTYQEMVSACGNTNVSSNGFLDNCNYFIENNTYSSLSANVGYWLETPYSSDFTSAWAVYGHGRYISFSHAGYGGAFGVRPVIEVSRSDISY